MAARFAPTDKRTRQSKGRGRVGKEGEEKSCAIVAWFLHLRAQGPKSGAGPTCQLQRQVSLDNYPHTHTERERERKRKDGPR